MTRRLSEHRRLWEHGACVPPILGITRSCAAVGGRPLMLFEYLPGRDAEEAVALLEMTTTIEAMREAGAALARLHRVPVSGFGDPVVGLGPGPQTWSEVVAARVELLVPAYRAIDDVPARLVESALCLLCRLAEEVSPVVRPAVAHLDVYLPNILLDHDGRFRALLDLEHVRWVDPVLDFVKPAMWMFTDRPEWADAFLDGYGGADEWPVRWSRRMSVATGLELLTGVEYWTRVADQAMRQSYLQRLRDWVSSGGADHAWSPISSSGRR